MTINRTPPYNFDLIIIMILPVAGYFSVCSPFRATIVLYLNFKLELIGHPQPHRALWSHMEPYGALRSPAEPFRALWNPAEP